MTSVKYKYVRIQGKELARNTMTGKGIFSMCWDLIRNDTMDEEDASLFREIDSWFAENLPWPEPCMRQEPVICWFKMENTEEMMKMIRPALWLLERYNHPYYLVYTNTPGEIVYEDKFQICTIANTPGEIVYEDKFQICTIADVRIDDVPQSWAEESGAPGLKDK